MPSPWQWIEEWIEAPLLLAEQKFYSVHVRALQPGAHADNICSRQWSGGAVQE
ncbi:hypothetical protein SynBIOSU31_01357 [Synechococcus sp. BIOS-U3-1]|nr:hypothetical protein SynBIOSU31_01357 [Synechococcus sp. BIOS-U3-1]